MPEEMSELSASTISPLAPPPTQLGTVPPSSLQDAALMCPQAGTGQTGQAGPERGILCSEEGCWAQGPPPGITPPSPTK